jgi:hypothetical protein
MWRFVHFSDNSSFKGNFSSYYQCLSGEQRRRVIIEAQAPIP